MIVRDFYFAAWAIEMSNVGYCITRGKLDLHITEHQFDTLKTEYSNSHKPIFDRVRSIVKHINTSS